MNATRNNARVCMRFEASKEEEKNSSTCEKAFQRTQILKKQAKLTKRQITILLFDNCDGCLKMAAVPHGAFAARKVREVHEQRFLISKMEGKGGNDKDKKQENGYSKKNAKEEGRELTPLKYNSKLMNSIWGLYNRYSVHNFKKNTDADDEVVGGVSWGSAIKNNRPPTKSAEVCNAAETIKKFFSSGNSAL